MPNVLLPGYSGEGKTDGRFFGPLIQRVFEDILFGSDGQIDCMAPEWLGVAKGKEIAVAAVKAGDNKLMLYCAHVDEDGKGTAATIRNQLQPALDLLAQGTAPYPPLIPVLPKEETESWLLADTDTLRRVLNTDLTNAQLKLHGNPEAYTNPKQKLVEVIRTVNAEPNRYTEVLIEDLYAPMGTDCKLDVLRNLSSFQRFEAATRQGLITIGYLRE